MMFVLGFIFDAALVLAMVYMAFHSVFTFAILAVFLWWLFFKADLRSEHQKNDDDPDVQAQRAWHAARGEPNLYQSNGKWYWRS